MPFKRAVVLLFVSHAALALVQGVSMPFKRAVVLLWRGGKWLDAKGFGGVLREPGQRV